MQRLKRREFITLLGGAAAWPLAARGQQGERMRRIGVLAGGAAATDADTQERNAAFAKSLQELGWVVGRNVQIDFRYGLGNAANIRKYAAELVALAPDVILVSGALALAPLLQVTRTVPIVFVSIADPVGTGLVASLARPGQNVTGLSSQTSELAGKRLEVLRELIPGLHRLAILANADAPHAVLEMADTEKTARKLGIEVVTSEIRRAEDIAPAFEAFKGRADALVVSPEPLMFTNRLRINILAAAARLPEAGIKATASLFN